MERNITAPTRALVTLANNAVKRNAEKGIESDHDAIDAFFNVYQELEKFPDAIVVDMNTRKESRFDGDYFSNYHAITAWLSHEYATHIILQSPNGVAAFVIDQDERADLVIL